MPARAAEADLSASFREGGAELSVGGGYGVFNNDSYLVLLLGGAYYLRDGLSAGATGEAWTGSRPQIYDVSPQLRYVFLASAWRYKPYVGVFYRRTSYSRNLAPLDSGGARAGLVFPLSSRAYLTGGLAFEDYFGCDRNVYSSCSNVSPEIGIAFGL